MRAEAHVFVPGVAVHPATVEQQLQSPSVYDLMQCMLWQIEFLSWQVWYSQQHAYQYCAHGVYVATTGEWRYEAREVPEHVVSHPPRRSGLDRLRRKWGRRRARKMKLRAETEAADIDDDVAFAEAAEVDVSEISAPRGPALTAPSDNARPRSTPSLFIFGAAAPSVVPRGMAAVEALGALPQPAVAETPSDVAELEAVLRQAGVPEAEADIMAWSLHAEDVDLETLRLLSSEDLEIFGIGADVYQRIQDAIVLPAL